MQAKSLLMTRPRKRRIKDSVGQFLHDPDTGQDMKEAFYRFSIPCPLLCASHCQPVECLRTEVDIESLSTSSGPILSPGMQRSHAESIIN